MDPFSSLNLARSTIQLIDWSSKLLSGAYEIYQSPDGQTRDDAELGEGTAILRRLAFGLANRPLSHVVKSKCQPLPSQPVDEADSEDAILEEKEKATAYFVQEKEKTVGKFGFNDAMVQLSSGHDDEDKPMGSDNRLDVDQAYEKLQELTSEMKSDVKAFAAEHVLRSEQEQGLQRVAMGCDDMAKRLEATLEELRVDPKNTKFRKISSFRQAFVRLCSQKKIDAMERSLDKYRRDLVLQLSVIMSDQQSSVARELCSLRDASSRLGSAYEDHLDNISKSFRLIQTEATKNAHHLRRQDPAAFKTYDDDNEVEGKRFNLFSLHKSHGPSDKGGPSHSQSSLVVDDDTPQAFQYLAETLRSLVSTATDVAIAQRVLSGLHYKTMTMRMESVVKAYTDTYEWIFKPRWAMDAKGIKVRFTEWLAEKNDIFWVSGKPGSGKSTFMKFLCDHHRTSEALVNWARPLNSIMSTHFFWSSGTAMQKSQEGLLRSLLYDVFKKSPKIMKMVCPQRWEASREGECDVEPWTLSELRRTLTTLATCDGLGYKFCFFIDGLDEYEGDHSEIIALLRSLAASPHIKLCVSSRPWNVFEDEYGRFADRKLYLQDLTSQDICHYVQRKLEEHPNWQILPSEEPLYKNLLEEVTTKAQRVFLWVFLVVRSLYEGLTNGDSLLALERRTRDLPADLESFFKHMLDSVDSFYHVQMVRTFQVAMGSTCPLLMALAILPARRFSSSPSKTASVSHSPDYTIEEPDLTPMVRLLLEEIQSIPTELLDGEAWASFIMAFVKILTDEVNFFPIVHMAQHRLGIIELLLAHGANPNVRWTDSVPVWHHLLIAMACPRLPPCPALLQIAKSFLSAGASLSGPNWSTSKAFAGIFVKHCGEDETTADTGRLDFLVQLCCLLISHGMELDAEDWLVIQRRLPSRLSESVLTVMEQQKLEKRVRNQAVTDEPPSWTWTSWLGLLW